MESVANVVIMLLLSVPQKCIVSNKSVISVKIALSTNLASNLINYVITINHSKKVTRKSSYVLNHVRLTILPLSSASITDLILAFNVWIEMKLSFVHSVRLLQIFVPQILWVFHVTIQTGFVHYVCK